MNAHKRTLVLLVAARNAVRVAIETAAGFSTGFTLDGLIAEFTLRPLSDGSAALSVTGGGPQATISPAAQRVPRAPCNKDPVPNVAAQRPAVSPAVGTLASAVPQSVRPRAELARSAARS